METKTRRSASCALIIASMGTHAPTRDVAKDCIFIASKDLGDQAETSNALRDAEKSSRPRNFKTRMQLKVTREAVMKKRSQKTWTRSNRHILASDCCSSFEEPGGLCGFWACCWKEQKKF
mmetsp:Transcript_71/g.165  ORF Transcript_71/g.165 Transcript_71/m.165 type:complete len:120 (+) Transcript_71:561-920(+)